MISVVVPVFNGEETIGRCIESVLAQTYNDYEIIIVNDGSIDLTEKKVLQFLSVDSRVRLISQENRGVSAARNCGISNAMGDYICFIDGDDYVSPLYLEQLIKMTGNDVLPVVNYMLSDSTTGMLLNKQSLIEIDFAATTISKEYLLGDLGKQIGFSVWNKLFSRKIIVENGIYFAEDINIGEDLVFVFLYLCNCGTIRVCSQPLYHYCIQTSSAVRAPDTDYSIKYERTYTELQGLASRGLIDEAVLPYWAVKVLPYVLGNNFVSNKNYKDFQSYFYELKTLELVKSAERVRRKNMAWKEKVLLCVIKRKKANMLFLLVKSYRLWKILVRRR